MSEQSEPNAANSSAAPVVVSRTVACPVKRVWKELMTKDGAEALLGPGAEFGEKGHTWRSADGRTGVVRTLHPMEELRFSFRKDDQSPPTIVRIDLTADGDSTTLLVTHSNLGDDIDPAWVTQRWQAALERIDDYLKDSGVS